MFKYLFAAIIIGNTIVVEAKEGELKTFGGNMDMMCGNTKEVFDFMLYHKYNDNITSELVNTANVPVAQLYKFTHRDGRFQYWVRDKDNDAMCLVANSDSSGM